MKRLLFLCHNLPWPLQEGAQVRSYHTLRLLSEAFNVSALCFYKRQTSPTEHQLREATQHLSQFADVQTFAVPQQWSTARRLWDHARSVVSRTSYTRWAYDARSVHEAVRRLTARGSFDLVHLDSLSLVAFARAVPDVPLVVAHHNVESALLARRADYEQPSRRAYMRHQAGLMKRDEREWCSRASLNVMVSDQDAARLSEIAPSARTFVMPNGVDTSYFAPSRAQADIDLVFVGNGSWFPNADGMEFFASRVLPLIRETRPEVRVRWIGRTSPETARRYESLGIDVPGFVPDLRSEVARARCVVVPLRVGGGTRLKILEAWSLGKAVVSTSIGCEGLRAEPGDNILVADSAQSFAAEVVRLIGDSRLRESLGRRARQTVVQYYDWDTLGVGMKTVYRDLATRR